MTFVVKTCFCKGGRTGRRVGELTHFRLMSWTGFPALGLGPKAHNHTPVSTFFPLPSPGSGWPCGSLGGCPPISQTGKLRHPHAG